MSCARRRCARYSVWPVKAMPASLMMLFCTGAVTIASNSPLLQPAIARSSSSQHPAGVAGIEAAGVSRTVAAAHVRRESAPSPAAAHRSQRALPSSDAVGQTDDLVVRCRPAGSSAASSRHRSGPMPAGSPQVRTRRGRALTGVQTSVSTKASSRSRRSHSSVSSSALLSRSCWKARWRCVSSVVSNWRRPSSCTMCQPNCAAERLADLVLLEARENLLEFRHERARAVPAEVAAVDRRARVLRQARGERREILALEDALARIREALAHRGVVLQLVRLHQDVTRHGSASSTVRRRPCCATSLSLTR